jgi:hypothetical protein
VRRSRRSAFWGQDLFDFVPQPAICRVILHTLVPVQVGLQTGRVEPEAVLVELRRALCDQAGEASARCVDHVTDRYRDENSGTCRAVEGLAGSIATGQVVANQIAVVPPGGESEAKGVNSDLDKGIEKNLDAALIQNKMHGSVKYDVKNGVVTLTGEVASQSKRDRAEKVATSVPNVTQVVNDLQVKNQKASSSH